MYFFNANLHTDHSQLLASLCECWPCINDIYQCARLRRIISLPAEPDVAIAHDPTFGNKEFPVVGPDDHEGFGKLPISKIVSLSVKISVEGEDLVCACALFFVIIKVSSLL